MMIVLFNSFGWFISWLQIVSSLHTYTAPYLFEYLRENPCRALEFSGTLPWDPQLPWPPWTPSSFSSIQGDYWALPGSPSCATVWKLSLARSWGSHKSQFVYFPSLRDHCPSLPDVQYLENWCFLYVSSFLVVPSRRSHPALVIPASWPEEEVLPNTRVWVASLSVILSSKGGVLWEKWLGELAT